ncbi:NAD-dependent epimerase/dehydratase family protein [Thioclava sp. ES.031]|uniref:NAD-dependent epimerase/dehydratase family protein n=1 Tax=Thioclava sp. ES.031 TaxID=1798203 RepID=UPI0020D22ECE|nr:NAD-dependent epimerase/dehydratase family protein [Thioclava sp. ES.031]
MKHVLVTGGAGYIGSHACKALAAAGYVPSRKVERPDSRLVNFQNKKVATTARTKADGKGFELLSLRITTQHQLLSLSNMISTRSHRYNRTQERR